MLSQFSFAPGVFERDLPFPAGVDLVVACSGVEAAKTGSAREQYNRASIRARLATEAFNRATGSRCQHLRQIALRVGPEGLTQALEAIRRGHQPGEEDLDLPGRFEQFFREDQQLIPAVGDALAAGDLRPIGELADASHRLADRGLQNQVEQTNYLQQSARRLGAMAASYFGAGFGGSVWAMIEKNNSPAFVKAWAKAYRDRFPQQSGRSEFFTTRPGPPARVAE
jgi:galactokinase